jgi:hypothetical protein
VNIYDLIDAARTHRRVRLFPWAGALAVYTKETEKIYPKKKAKGELMKFMLRQIFH